MNLHPIFMARIGWVIPNLGHLQNRRAALKVPRNLAVRCSLEHHIDNASIHPHAKSCFGRHNDSSMILLCEQGHHCKARGPNQTKKAVRKLTKLNVASFNLNETEEPLKSNSYASSGLNTFGAELDVDSRMFWGLR